MTHRTPTAGDLWTVPSLGPKALVVLLTEPRILPGGVEFEAAPVYTAPLLAGWTTQDFRVAAEETSLGHDLRAAFWNLHPVLGSRLGQLVGHVDDEQAFETLLDAYVQAIGAPVYVPAERWGSIDWTVEVYRSLSPEIRRWREISAEVITLGEAQSHVFCEMVGVAGELAKWNTQEYEVLLHNILHGDESIPAPRVVATGPNVVLFAESIRLGNLAIQDWGFVMKGIRDAAHSILWKPLTKSRYHESQPVRVKFTDAVVIPPKTKGANTEMALCA